MTEIADPHDSFFRETFGRKDIAASFLKEYLPKAISDKIDMETLSIISESRIFLFGSRVDDTCRGGDIDILILTKNMTYDDKLTIKKEFFNELEEQKIDIVISRHGDEPFVKMIFEQGVELQ